MFEHNQNSEWTPHSNLLPFMFSDTDLNELEVGQKIKKERDEKLNMFEAGLAYELNENDTIDGSIEKIVKVALAAEYGVSITKEEGFKRMALAITQSITQDPILRKQALIIVDRFTQRAQSNKKN